MLFCQADSTFSAIVFPFIRNMENRNVSQRADVSSSYCPPTHKKKAAVVSCSSRLVEHLALLYDGKIGNNSDRRLVIFESVKFDVDISVDVAQKTPNQSDYNKRKTSHKCTFIPHLFIHIFFFYFLEYFLVLCLDGDGSHKTEKKKRRNTASSTSPGAVSCLREKIGQVVGGSGGTRRQIGIAICCTKWICCFFPPKRQQGSPRRRGKKKSGAPIGCARAWELLR